MNVWLERASRLPRPPWWVFVVVGLWIGLIVLVSASFGGSPSAPSLCQFRNATGIPCPGCGGTRGARAILDGSPERAFDLNPLLFAFLTLWGVFFVRRLATGTRVVVRLTSRGRRVAWTVGTTLLLLGWAYVIWRQGTDW